ncbi:MAG: glycoside hydrolase family 172 protein [Candidatus Odinarchaeota archaeon]
MTSYPILQNYEELVFTKDITWRTRQVSTHGHDRIVDLNSFNPQWKPFHKRGVKHRDNVGIEPQGEYEFPIIEGPGCIVNIWFTFTPYNLRKLLKYYRPWEARKKVKLRIFFDEEKYPSIDSPIGDFFGVGFGQYREYRSKYLEETSGGYVCRFPMPFKKQARVMISNTSDSQTIEAFYGAVTYRQYKSGFPHEPFYFHARYREEIPTSPGIPYKLLDAKGEGFYAGCVLNQENIKKRVGYRFLEGNTKIYVDGETNPSLEYTGTEDLFQGAWYYAGGTFSAPYSGCTVHSWKKIGIFRFLRGYTRTNRVSQYRFHEQDTIPFQKSLLVFTHHGEFDEIPANQSSVSYYYARKPVSTNWDPLKRGDFPDEGYY